MAKIKINTINGKPVCPGVSLGNGKTLIPEHQPDRHLDSDEYRTRTAQGLNVTTADVDDIAPYKHLIDRGAIVTVAGRPRAAAANPD